MQINVSQLLQEPVGSVREIEISDSADVLVDGVMHDVTGHCRLLRTPRSLLARCRLNTEIELACSRCLAVFRLPLKLKFEEEFFPTADVSTGAPLALPDEPGIFTIDEHHILDLTEALHQYAVLATPMKPLCHDACAGLCPRCGQNLNQGQCDCPRQVTDPRWTALARLKK